MGNARAVRYRRLALAEEDNAKADLLYKLDESDRGLLCTADWLSVRPSQKNEQPPKAADVNTKTLRHPFQNPA
jgi:hypothetical protein